MAKKSSDEIHERHARQKAQRDKERVATGYRGKNQSKEPPKKEDSAVPSALVAKFIGQFRLHRASQISKAHVRKEYKPRKV